MGIDVISFSTSKYFLDLKTLAMRRDVDYRKYCEGIGQIQMAVFPQNEDIVTIGIDAAQKAISKIKDKNDIDLVMFATESTFDLSKSAAIYVHHFLGLKPNCRVFDIKQACYSGTAALQMAYSFIDTRTLNSNSKVLIIASDIVKYSPGTSGEPTQGGAAVAMIMSKNARTLLLEPFSGIYTCDIADFWRPAATNEAKFDGRLSAHNYLKSLEYSLKEYMYESGLTKTEIDYNCFHTPFCKMARKAAKQYFPYENIDKSLIYASLVGNSCSASLYLSLISLIDHSESDLSGKRIGMYSYGSGSVAEYFSGIVADEYKSVSFSDDNKKKITDRIEISFDKYETFCSPTPFNCKIEETSYKNIGNITLSEIKNGYRIYNLTTL
ncbi:MAG: hydroxymethylglutaryl-CoA synthase [Alphaproteobacteria bacterium]|nr:hydroxymethylglutaryl-CoA synthase [Alphaproteobacteria bacterium]